MDKSKYLRGIGAVSGAGVQLTDITDTRSVLSLMGPRSREILSLVTKTDVSNEAFSFATTQNIQISGCDVMAIRITYVGELGFELHMAVADAPRVYDELFSHGASLGLKNAGYRAIESLRLERDIAVGVPRLALITHRLRQDWVGQRNSVLISIFSVVSHLMNNAKPA